MEAILPIIAGALPSIIQGAPKFLEGAIRTVKDLVHVVKGEPQEDAMEVFKDNRPQIIRTKAGPVKRAKKYPVSRTKQISREIAPKRHRI